MTRPTTETSPLRHRRDESDYTPTMPRLSKQTLWSLLALHAEAHPDCVRPAGVQHASGAVLVDRHNAFLGLYHSSAGVSAFVRALLDLAPEQIRGATLYLSVNLHHFGPPPPPTFSSVQADGEFPVSSYKSWIDGCREVRVLRHCELRCVGVQRRATSISISARIAKSRDHVRRALHPVISLRPDLDETSSFHLSLLPFERRLWGASVSVCSRKRPFFRPLYFCFFLLFFLQKKKKKKKKERKTRTPRSPRQPSP
jgi:hypothetical protein